MNTRKTKSSISRRSFLMTTTAAALASGVAHAAGASPRKIRMGVVGGGFGTDFQWHEHPDAIVEAVSDLRPERRNRLAQVYHCAKTYESLEKLVLDEKIDAVAIFTEGPNHVKHVVEAMKHGKHVISAVPAAVGYSVNEGLELAQLLAETVKKAGLTYMMAETGYYQQFVISMRQALARGDVAGIHYCESEYLHPGLESLWFEGGKPTWRHGLPPMFYPTHCTAHMVGITGERLTEVSCHGWADADALIKGNPYNNPFWNETAMFRTDKGNAFRVRVWWKGPVPGGERGWWWAAKMGDYEKRNDWYRTMLPEPLRHPTGHESSHGFITNEFIEALLHGRKPTVDVQLALACTVPGIVAHQSALKGGELMKVPQYA